MRDASESRSRDSCEIRVSRYARSAAMSCKGLRNLTFSKISCSLDSVCLSSSEAFGGIFGTLENCE